MNDVKIKLKKIKLCRTLVKDIRQYLYNARYINKNRIEYLNFIMENHGIIDSKISWDYDRLSDTINISFYDSEINKNYGLKFIIKNSDLCLI